VQRLSAAAQMSGYAQRDVHAVGALTVACTGENGPERLLAPPFRQSVGDPRLFN
jgi:hypothetical protein